MLCGIFQPHRHGLRDARGTPASARRVRTGSSVAAAVAASEREQLCR